MDIREAERARVTRIYRWALEMAQAEVKCNYPLHRLVGGHSVQVAIAALEEYSSLEARLSIVRALVKRKHGLARLLLRDPIERADLRLSEDFYAKRGGIVMQAVNAIMHDGMKGTEISYREVTDILRTTMLSLTGAKGKGSESYGRDYVVEAGDWLFTTKIKTAPGRMLDLHNALRRKDDSGNVWHELPSKHDLRFYDITATNASAAIDLLGLATPAYFVISREQTDAAIVGVTNAVRMYQQHILPLVADLQISSPDQVAMR